MTNTDQIAAALAWINETANAMSMVGDKQKGKALKALAADYERQREDIERLKRENAELRAKVERLNVEVARATYGRPYD